MRVRRPGTGWASAVLALAVVLGGAGSATAQRPDCLPGCDPMNNPTACCVGCIDAPCDDYVGCLRRAQERLIECSDRCPADAGRCTLARECVFECRKKQASQRAQCNHLLQRALRDGCGDGETCRISKGTARRACRACNLGPEPPPPTPPPDQDPCQSRCIDRLVHACYAECADRCDGDVLARRRCRRGCRNAQCATLKGNCVEGGGPDAAQYEECCAAQGSCSSDVSCQVTSTTSTVTSTTVQSSTTTVQGASSTSTVTSSTSTTTFFGV